MTKGSCKVGKVVAINDLADRRYPVDMVINQNIGAETFRIEKGPPLLRGQ